MTELKTLREMTLDYPGEPKVTTRVLIREKQKSQTQRQIGRHHTAGFEKGGSRHAPRNAGDFQSWRKQGTDSFLEPPEGRQTLLTLSF